MLIFEMTTKAWIGRLDLPRQFQDKLPDIYQVFGLAVLDVIPQHADLAGRLPGAHKDPFDRLLTAQAIVEDMAIMTIDTRIAELGARVVWRRGTAVDVKCIATEMPKLWGAVQSCHRNPNLRNANKRKLLKLRKRPPCADAINLPGCFLSCHIVTVGHGFDQHMSSDGVCDEV